MDKSKIETISEIELLRRKLSREQKAREIAEQQLEVYSREAYQANQSLKKALARSNKKHAENEYLIKASQGLSPELTLADVLQNTVELTCWYLNAQYGIHVTVNEQNVQRDPPSLVWSSDDLWHENSDIEAYFFKYFPYEKTRSTPQWLIWPIDDDEEINGEKFLWNVCINFKLANESSVWIGFLTKTDVIDEDALQMLEVAKGTLGNGIRRRLSDEQALKEKVQLQKTETHLQELQNQLIQSEKMASLGQLAAGVAHEINNPIGYIRANLHVLKDYMQEFKALFKTLSETVEQEGSLSKQHFDAINSNQDMEFLLEDTDAIIVSNMEGVERVKEIVENLKSFSHAGNDNLSDVSIFSCMNRALDVVSNELKYQHHVVNELDDSLPNITANGGQLQQVFVNLLINSAHSMPNGGKISIYSTKDDSHLFIHIKDEGVGMDEKTKNQIFTPFFTTKPVGEGTGLGLSVSYAILEAHNVSINVESQLGEGTCFKLGFPLN